MTTVVKKLLYETNRKLGHEEIIEHYCTFNCREGRSVSGQRHNYNILCLHLFYQFM